MFHRRRFVVFCNVNGTADASSIHDDERLATARSTQTIGQLTARPYYELTLINSDADVLQFAYKRGNRRQFTSREFPWPLDSTMNLFDASSRITLVARVRLDRRSLRHLECSLVG